MIYNKRCIKQRSDLKIFIRVFSFGSKMLIQGKVQASEKVWKVVKVVNEPHAFVCMVVYS